MFSKHIVRVLAIPLFTSTLHSPTQMPQLRLHNTMASSSASIPKTMKGVQMKTFGGPEVLQYKTDLPVPVPHSGEVLVKNDYIGINYVDVFVALLTLNTL